MTGEISEETVTAAPLPPTAPVSDAPFDAPPVVPKSAAEAPPVVPKSAAEAPPVVPKSAAEAPPAVMKLETEEILSQNKISQPREHRAKICVWADLSVNDLDELFNMWASPRAVKDILSRIFQIDQDDKAPMVLDLYYYTLQYAKDNNFNTEQTSAFFSMVKQTHEICTETPFDNFDLCFKHFKEQLLCHAVKRPPFSLDLFDAEQVKGISQYVINTYFRHYKMYKYAFTPTVRLDLTMKYTGIPETPAPSEHGDVTTEEQEALENESEEKEDETKPEDEKEEQEESEPAKKLRAMIKQHLQEEIKKLRESVENQLKNTEETLSQKLTTAEGGKPAGKGGRGSAKGKKK